MRLLIQRGMIYITMLAAVVLVINLVPDINLSGYITGVAGLTLFISLSGHLLHTMVSRWGSLINAARVATRFVNEVWEYLKLQSYGDVYVMSFFTAAFGLFIVVLGLEGITTNVSQAAEILVPGYEAFVIVAFGSAGLLLSAVMVILPEKKTPYYGSVGLIVLYATFSLLNTWQRSVTGRGALATLIITALVYFAFRTMVQQGVTIRLRETLRKTIIARETDELLIRRLSETDMQNVATTSFAE